MPPRERTLREKQIEKRKILDCSIDIINTEGYHSLSMRKVAKKLNFSATKIYSFFHNKDEVYLALVVESYRMFLNEIEDSLIKATTSNEQVQCLVESIVRFSKEYRHNYEILFNLKSPKYLDYVDTPLQEIALEKQKIGFEWFNLVKQVIEDYAHDNNIKIKYDIDTTILIIFSNIHGAINLYHNKLIHEVSEDPDAFLNIVTKITLDNIDNILN